MASSAPQSPARRDGTSYFDTSPDRPSPSKLLRIHQLCMDRASSLPARRLSSPAKRAPLIRPRLNQYHTLDHAVSLFQSSRNIIVLTGAGISTSLGVPDFRSTTGVYSLLEDSPYNDPQELFHIENFKTDPKEFFKQAAKVFPRMRGLVPLDDTVKSKKTADGSAQTSVPKFSLTHAFIAMLQAKDKLLTNYTQNIDGLEVVAGVQSSRLIQCHGTLATATCMSCGKRTTARKYMPVIQGGGIPYCKCSLESERPKPKSNKQRGRSGKKKRKRDEFEDTDSEDTSSKADFPKGLLKPDMTFFGEDIADSYAPRLKMDKSKVDLLVIVGTSLKVEPVNEMLLNIPPTVPQIWISKDRCQREGVKVDIELLGECDLILGEIARRAGWEDALQEGSWSSGKTFEVMPSIAKSADGARDKARIKRGDDSASPVKSDRPLQIRKKSNESSNLTVKPRSGIVIKVNDEEITPSNQTQHVPKPTDKATDDSLTVKAGLKSGTGSGSDASQAGKSTTRIIGGNDSEEKNDDDSRKGNPHQPLTRPKVIVELEEGTRSRWYIKRAK